MIERTQQEKILIEACRNNSLQLIIDYKNFGVDIHFDNDLLLRQATMCGSLNIVKYLIENGADIHFKEEEAFIFSIMKGHTHIFDYLLNFNINIDIQDGQAILFAVEHNNSYIINQLFQKGSKFLNEAFIFSITMQRQEMSQLLLTLGADIHFNNNEAFLTAIKYNNLDMFYYLLPFNPPLDDINKSKLDQTSLIWVEKVLLNLHLNSSLSEKFIISPVSKI